MDNKPMSMLDAFLALEDVKDEDVFTEKEIKKIKGLRRLKEAKDFAVNNSLDMDKAEDFIEEGKQKEDVELTVIDPDADTVDHLKNNSEYVGQYLLKCRACQNTKFIDGDKLNATTLEGEDFERYNVEDECPHCHSVGKGFELIGQVGKVPEAEPEVEVPNDSLTDDEVKFDNDLVDQEPEVNPEVPEVTPEEDEEPAAELDYDETTAEDDTADMEAPQLGDEVSDEVEYDDTEEKPVEEPEEEHKDDSLTNDEIDKYFGFELEDEPKKEEKKEESLEEDIDEEEIMSEHLDEFLDHIVEPWDIEDVVVINLDDDEKTVFSGSFEDLPETIKDSEFASFNVGEGRLTVNVDITDDAEPTLRDALAMFDDDFNDKIDIWDQSTGDNVFTGTKETCLQEYGDSAFLSFEAPEKLVLNLRNVEMTYFENVEVPMKEGLDLSVPEDELIYNVFVENGFRDSRIDKKDTPEFWIAQCIRNKDDLDVIYKNYIFNKGSDLIRQFKEVTGYKDEIERKADEYLFDPEEEKNFVEDDPEAAHQEALDKLRNEKAYAVIYGYQDKGEFVKLPEPMVVMSFRELNMARELLERKYNFTGSLRCVYNESYTEEFDVKTNQDLQHAIKECKENNWDYKVERSLTEGYKYKVTREILSEEVIKQPIKEEKVEEPTEQKVSEPEEKEFNEKEFEKFINEWFDKNVEETQTFECTEGFIEEDGSICLEGYLNLTEGQTKPVSFKLKENLNEGVSDKQSYTVTSDCLTESLICESPYLWCHAGFEADTEDEVKNFRNKYLKPDEDCVEKPTFYFNEDKKCWQVSFCTFDIKDDVDHEEVFKLSRESANKYFKD